MLQFHFAVLWITIRVVNSRENANKNFNFSLEMQDLREISFVDKIRVKKLSNP